MISESPKLELGECTDGTGGLCGAISLDNAFENYIRKRLAYNQSLLSVRRLAEIRRWFEQFRLHFNPLDSVDMHEQIFEVPIFGAADDPTIGPKDDYLVVKRCEVYPIGRD